MYYLYTAYYNNTYACVNISNIQITAGGTAWDIKTTQKNMNVFLRCTVMTSTEWRFLKPKTSVRQKIYFRMYSSFESDIHIKSWLLKVTVNECINTIKSSWNSKVIKSVNDNCEYDDNSSIVSSDSAVNNSSGYTNNSYEPLNSSSYKDFDIDSMYVWETVAALPQKYRDVIYLFYHEQYSTEEISDILGISTVNVRTRLKRAREILRKEVNDYEF